MPLVSDSIKAYAARAFSIDARSLALARVLCGLCLLWSLVVLIPHLSFYFAPEGFVTPPPHFFDSLRLPHWDFHRLFGSLLWVSILFAVEMFSALALIVGYRTTLATTVAFIFEVSLMHSLSPVYLAGGMTLRIVLFLGIWLEWGTAYSVDAARRGVLTKQEQYLSLWTAAALIQIALIYFFSGFSKSGAAWTSGMAVYYVTESFTNATRFGLWLHQFLPLTMVITYVTVYYQRCVALLLFFPIKTTAIRALTLVELILMHLLFRATLHIGWFSFISIAALAFFVPGAVWEFFSKKLIAFGFGNVRIYYDGECGFCRTSSFAFAALLAIPRCACLPAQTHPEMQRTMDQENSWIVEDAGGSTHIRYDAGLALLRASPIFFWLAPILAFSVSSRFGDRVYKYVVARRSRVCKTPPSWDGYAARLRPLSPYVAVLFLATVLTWNVDNLRSMRNNIRPPQHNQTFAYIMGSIDITQNWALFAPDLAPYRYWPVIVVESEGGASLDALRDWAPLDWREPADVDLHANMELLQILNGQAGAVPTSTRMTILHYYCRQYRKHIDLMTPSRFHYYLVSDSREGLNDAARRTDIAFLDCVPSIR